MQQAVMHLHATLRLVMLRHVTHQHVTLLPVMLRHVTHRHDQRGNDSSERRTVPVSPFVVPPGAFPLRAANSFPRKHLSGSARRCI